MVNQSRLKETHLFFWIRFVTFVLVPDKNQSLYQLHSWWKFCIHPLNMCNKPKEPEQHVSFIHSGWSINITLDKPVLQRSHGWCVYSQSLAVMVVFMCQIPLHRKMTRAKQAPRCQPSSCQGNEREMWRRGQTPLSSKRSAMLFV